MMGYDIGWASFYVLEVMSHPEFGFKRIGYLAASQSFNEDTEVIIITTNQFKKVCLPWFAAILCCSHFDLGFVERHKVRTESCAELFVEHHYSGLGA